MNIKKQKGFFDEDDRLAKSSKLGDSLERLRQCVFSRNIIEKFFKNHFRMTAMDGGREYDQFCVFWRIT